MTRANKRWTLTELKQLKKLYKKMEVSDVAELMGRSIYSIRNQADRMKLATESKKPWSSEELETLRAIDAEGVPGHVALERLPGRSFEAISRMRVRIRRNGKE